MELAKLELDVAHLGNAKGVLDCFGHLTEQPSHFLGSAQVVGVTVHSHALRLVDGLASADAEENIMGTGLSLVDVVDIVGGY